ncbi:MAG: gamma-glutamylcyclotransferase [Ilumatobacter sp.]|nr:gamma-glutamylcyclotransferase [Ilumatobacter sp.]
MSGVWIFGYGSLVSPTSFGFTLGRELLMGVDVFEAELDGYGRRWNYGTATRFWAPRLDDGRDHHWTFVALGIEAAAGETTNGVVAHVTDDELPALDRRERNYDRVDVTDQVTIHGRGGPSTGDRIVTYVPGATAIDLYETARARGEAAITRRYWDLVDGAFAALGHDRRERYHATTPLPDIPVIVAPDEQTPVRHRA